MSLRPGTGIKRWSICDLPILPFLAPRVFQPWPARGRSRNYTTSETVSHQGRLEPEHSQSRTEELGHGNRPRRAGREEAFAKNDSPIFAPILPPSKPRRPSAVGPARYRSNLHEKLVRKNKPRPRFPQYNFPLTPKRTGRSIDVSLFFRFSNSQRTLAAQKDLIRRSGRRYVAKSLPKGFKGIDQEISCMRFDRSLDNLLTSNFDTEPHQEELATLLDLLKTSSTSVGLLARWKKLDIYDREQIWPTLLIKVARDSPHQLMKLLSGTWVAPHPPVALMTDAVDFVVFHHLSGLRASEQSQMSALVLYRAIKGLLLQGPFAYVQLSQYSIFLLIQNLAEPGYIADVYHFLNQIGNPLTVDTLSHFVAKLAINDDHGNLAYDIFRRIGDMQPNFNDHSLQSLCTTVLMHSHQEMEYSHSEKFEYMLKCGLTPNIITYNTLLLKLLKSGDTAASWEIFRLMKENGPEPDAYTMSTLLNDAKLRRDTACVSEILGFAQQKGVESAIMTTDILHLTSLVVHEKNSREKRRAAETNEEPRGLQTPFEVMLPYYCKYFYFKPLAHLLPGLSERYPEFVDEAPLTPENIRSADNIDEKRLLKVDPDNAVLVVMISTLLRDYDDADTAKWFYEHLKNLMKSQDPLVMQLTRASSGSYALHLYNTIIMALGRHASNIPLCLQILGEMSPPKAEPTNGTGNSLVGKSLRDNESLVPRPTSATWGILTNIFMDHRQPRAAEKVISMMRERGIQPTTMNWGVLLKGYSRLQDAEAVVGAIQRTERAGFSFEKVTQRVFRQVADRRALMEGIRRYQLMKMKEQVETPRVVAPLQVRKEHASTSIEEIDVGKCGIGDMEVREVLSDEEILSQSNNRRANRDKKRWPGESEGNEDAQSHAGRTRRRHRNRGVRQTEALDHDKLLSYLAEEIS